MCDPATAIMVAGMAASAGGSYMQSRNQNKNMKMQQAAKNDAFRSGMDRQEGYANEAGQAFGRNITAQGKSAFDEQLDQAFGRRSQAFDNARANAGDYSIPTLASAPKNVVIAQDRAFGAAADRSKQQSDALAKLTGYTDASFNQGLGRNEYNRAFGNLADKAGRDSRLIGIDMNAAANNAYKGPGILPMALKTAGSAASMYGAAGAPGLPFGGAPTAPTPVPNPRGQFGGYM